jgi:excisionase family DNA binding protein
MPNEIDLRSLLDLLSESLADKVIAKLDGHPTAARNTRLLTLEQAASYLGRTKEALQHMVACGKLPTVRADRRVFIDVDDLDRWIVENKHKGLV